MIDKVDLIMWTKEGARTLSPVLERIDKVIPEEVVDNRILVDDSSVDNTREIAKSYGWRVFFNEGKGISSGANTALKYVTSEFFISFEQDLVLVREWWRRIPKYLSEDKVAVASGVRVPNRPVELRKLEEYTIERCQTVNRKEADFFYGRTLDNTIYKTSIIRKLGGFPHLSISVGVDNILAKKLFSSGYEWKVDYNVRSIHLRSGLKDELAHYYWYGTCSNKILQILTNKPVDLRRNVLRLFFSPIQGFNIAMKKNVPGVVYVYPLIVFNILKGILDSRKKRME